MYHIWIFSFSGGLAPNHHYYLRFPVRLLLTYSSLSELVWAKWTVHLGQAVKTHITHIIQIIIYRTVYYFAKSSYRMV